MSCRYAVGDDRCQYESYTLSNARWRAHEELLLLVNSPIDLDRHLTLARAVGSERKFCSANGIVSALEPILDPFGPREIASRELFEDRL